MFANCTNETLQYNNDETTNASECLLDREPNFMDLLPTFNTRPLIIVIIYGIFFLVSSVGNVTVFSALIRPRRKRSRFNFLILNLTLADMIVTFIMLPLEIIWRITVQWIAGNVACKILLFWRAFGLYSSSNVLICISLDRYFAIVHPLKVTYARSRGKRMILYAWIISALCALPQIFVFHTAVHPKYENFTQCVTYGFFETETQESVYIFFGMVAMYFAPLLVILFTYPAIFWKIHKKLRESKEAESEKNSTALRRSDIRAIKRAKIKTLKMAVIIMVVFMVCWTPYVVISLWYTFDKTGAHKIPFWIQECLFMMAISNSCVNPMVYGSYAIDFKEQCRLLCGFRKKHRKRSERIDMIELI